MLQMTMPTRRKENKTVKQFLKECMYGLKSPEVRSISRQQKRVDSVMNNTMLDR